MRIKSVIVDSNSESTDKSKNDFEYSTQISRLVSTPIGLWPLDVNANILKKIFFQFFVVVICYFLICFFVISCSLHMLLIETRVQVKIKFLGPLSVCFMALAKYSILLSRREEIRNCLNHIDSDWRRIDAADDSEERQIMLTSAKKGRYIGGICAAFMYSAGVFYRIIVPLSVGTQATPDNTTIRPLVFRVYEPIFGGINTPSYELCFCQQWFSGLVGYSIAISTCSITAVFVLHACGQLRIVRHRINDFVQGKKNINNSIEDRIAEIIELHLRILGFIFRIEKIFSEVCFIDFVGCTCNMFFTGYSAVMMVL